jgi:DNA-binding response OmpR family regulator
MNKPPKILVVEDDPILAKGLARQLIKIGFEVLPSAESGCRGNCGY